MTICSSQTKKRRVRLCLSPRRQRGAVLIVSLFILLLMTLIGVTSMSTTSLEEKMAGNMRDKNIALQAAESALDDADLWLMTQNTQPFATTSCGTPPCDVWDHNVLPDPVDQPQSWWQNTAREYGTRGSNEISDVNKDPFYVIEKQAEEWDSPEIGTHSSRIFYRVTARGTGGTDDAQAVLQTTVALRFN